MVNRGLPGMPQAASKPLAKGSFLPGLGSWIPRAFKGKFSVAFTPPSWPVRGLREFDAMLWFYTSHLAEATLLVTRWGHGTPVSWALVSCMEAGTPQAQVHRRRLQIKGTGTHAEVGGWQRKAETGKEQKGEWKCLRKPAPLHVPAHKAMAIAYSFLVEKTDQGLVENEHWLFPALL